MAASRFPSLNGLEKELFSLREGHGLSIVKIEKINSAPHVLHALRISLDGSRAPSDQALAAREALVEFIENCGVLQSDHRVALTCVLNLDPDADYYNAKLPARRLDLEVLLKIGRRKRTALETNSIRLLAEQLLNSARQRS